MTNINGKAALAEIVAGIDDANAQQIVLLSPARIRVIADYVAGLERALEFYRDGFSYLPSRSQTGIDLSTWALKVEILEDRGNVAIAALAQEGQS